MGNELIVIGLAFLLCGLLARAGASAGLPTIPLFVAAGINVTTDVKTITAKTLFERLAHLVPRFDKTIQKFCEGIAERRNAELHSADLPFRAMHLRVRFWPGHWRFLQVYLPFYCIRLSARQVHHHVSILWVH